MKMRLVFICFLFLGSGASAIDRSKPWITKLELTSTTKLRLQWVGVYEGFDTVNRIDVIRGGKVLKTFQISGQPVFNELNTLVALPDCWDGGCETTIRVLDLVAFTELPPIRFDREWFFKVAWEENKKLRVVLGGMNLEEKDEVRCFLVRASQSKKPLEPVECADTGLLNH